MINVPEPESSHVCDLYCLRVKAPQAHRLRQQFVPDGIRFQTVEGKPVNSELCDRQPVSRLTQITVESENFAFRWQHVSAFESQTRNEASLFFDLRVILSE